jgi:hypothetical protein
MDNVQNANNLLMCHRHKRLDPNVVLLNILARILIMLCITRLPSNQTAMNIYCFRSINRLRWLCNHTTDGEDGGKTGQEQFMYKVSPFI